MKNNLYILILLSVIWMGCNRQKSLEELLINKPNEAWIYFDNSPQLSYIVFKENKISVSCFRDDKTNLYVRNYGSADNEIAPGKWSVTNDSILKIGGNVFDVLSYDENTIFLYLHPENSSNRIIILEREKGYLDKKIETVMKKRQEFSEKYK